MGVDEVGVDEMGSRRSGTTPLYNHRRWLEAINISFKK